jgi:peptide/nickel transport system substrate-binding protein
MEEGESGQEHEPIRTSQINVKKNRGYVISNRRKRKMERKFILRMMALLAVLVMLASLSACAQPVAETPAVEEPGEEQPTEPAAPSQPEEEVVLRIAVGARFDDLSPLRGGGHSAFWLSMWWASPMYFDSEGQLQPYVFNEWEPNADFTVWTFKIDPEAVFSDGSVITAQDVKATWDLSAVPTTKHQRVGLFFTGVVGYDEVISGDAMQMSGIVAVDDATVEITLKDSDPVFYKRVSSNLIPPVKASQAVDANGEEVFEWWRPENGVVVSGPFMPVSMDLDKCEVVFVANPYFWMGEPKIDKLILTAVEDAQTAITLFQSGELDAMNEIFTPTLVDEMGEEFVSGAMIPRGHQFWLDWSKEPTNDINVRRALILSIDPDKVFEAAFPQGPGQAVHQLLVAVEGVDPDFVWYEPDAEAAQEALAASSYGSAENLPKLFFVGISQASHELASQYIAEQWRQILGIEEVEMKAAFDAYSGPDQERIQIFRDDAGARFPDPVAYLMGTIHSSSGPAQRKMGGYINPEVDRLLEEAATKGTDDPDRVALALQAHELFLQDYMFIPYYFQNMPRYAMPWVMNWSKNLDWQVVEPWNVYIESH